MGRRLVGLATIAVLVFLYIPIGIIFLYSFNADQAQTWPITNWTTNWYGIAFANTAIRDALLLSLEAGRAATVLALFLGSLAALAVHRFRFFGRETISFLLVLPLALPGIVTGMALNATFNTIGHRRSASSRSSSATPRSASSSSTTTSSPACVAPRPRSRRRRWTWAPTRGRRSAT